MSKYHAKKVRADGHLFDSQLEYRRYQQLSLLVSAGAISDLRIHPVYELEPKHVLGFGKDRRVLRAIRHELDFQYVEDGVTVVEDTKGVVTPVWKLKHNLFQRKFPAIQYRVLTSKDV